MRCGFWFVTAAVVATGLASGCDRSDSGGTAIQTGTVSGTPSRGSPRSTVASPTPTSVPQSPVLHGRYRIYSGDFVGELKYDERPDERPKGVVTQDLTVARSSTLWREPAYVPDGYVLASVDTGDSDSERVLNLEFNGPGEPIHISRIVRFTFPRDVTLPAPEETYSEFEATYVDVFPATLYYPKAGAILGSPLTVLSWFEGDVETNVYGEDLDPATARAIAAGVVCATDC